MIDVSVGPALLIVNVTALLVPAEVVTVTDRSPGAAAESIEKFAVINVPLETTIELTVTPVPLTVSVVAP